MLVSGVATGFELRHIQRQMNKSSGREVTSQIIPLQVNQNKVPPVAAIP
jgi:hypothetical protein